MGVKCYVKVNTFPKTFKQLTCGILKGGIKVVTLIPYPAGCEELKEVYCSFVTMLFRDNVLISLWFLKQLKEQNNQDTIRTPMVCLMLNSQKLLHIYQTKKTLPWALLSFKLWCQP